MMNERRFFVNPINFGVCIATIILSAVIGVTLITIDRPGSSALFFLISAVFIFESTNSGAVIRINEKGAGRWLFGKCTYFLTWEEIKEVGVAGSRIFLQSKKGKHGTMYIYLSPDILDDDKRFNMMLKTPKKYLILQYTKPRKEAIQSFWNGKLEKYNVNDFLL